MKIIDSTLNEVAKDMLVKACKKENGKILCCKDLFSGDYILINDDIYSSFNSKIDIAFAFEQLVNNGFANRKCGNDIEYVITDFGYTFARKIENSQE